jgi:peptidase E
VTDRAPTIVAMGGGGFSEGLDPQLDRYLLALTGRDDPRVCFVPTASGDSDRYIVRFYNAFQNAGCRPSHLPLFARRHVGKALRDFVLAQDLIYVGGGNTANLLAVWRLHGLDEILTQAWRAGVILAGLSAGSLCWFEDGVTDSFGAALQPLPDGLGLLPGSHCPHYDSEAGRRPTYTGFVAAGTLSPGYAADDGVGLRFTGRTLTEVVSGRPGGRAWHVTPDPKSETGARHKALEVKPLARDGST